MTGDSENTALLALLRGKTSGVSVPDWRRLESEAARHRVVRFIYPVLRCAAICPAETLVSMERRCAAIAARNELLVRRLMEICGRLAAAGLKVLPVKGPVLAVQAHGDPGARMYDDLDLIMPGDEVSAGADILMAAGYRPRLDLTDAERKAHIRAGWGFALSSPDGLCDVELNTHFGAGFYFRRLDFERLWQTRAPVSLTAGAVETMGREETFIFLCAHAMKHRWCHIGWLMDTAGLISQSPALDWPRIAATAHREGMIRSVRIGVELCRRLLGREPSGEAAALGNDGKSTALAERIARGIEDGIAGEESLVKQWAMQLAVRNRTRDKARYILLQMLAPSYSDWKAVRLPAGLFPLYWIIRPFRLLFFRSARTI